MMCVCFCYFNVHRERAYSWYLYTNAHARNAMKSKRAYSFEYKKYEESQVGNMERIKRIISF